MVCYILESFYVGRKSTHYQVSAHPQNFDFIYNPWREDTYSVKYRSKQYKE